MKTTTNNFFTLLTIFIFLFFSIPTFSSPLIDQLNQSPPSNFLTTITNNCLNHPSLRYCNSTQFDLTNIFKSTIVTSHLCNISNNPNCTNSFFSINLQTLPKLTPLYLSFSFFWKYCPISIQSINLSNNSLIGPFPSQILLCTQINSLDLSLNSFSGFLPIDSFTPLTNLAHLNLSYNQFSPQFDEKVVNFLKRFKDSSFLHSGVVKSAKDYKFRMTTTILLVVGVSAVVASLVGCLAWRMGKRHDFSERVIRKATDGFSEDRLVEKRDKVEIYRGSLNDGEEVVIKMQRGKKMLSEFRRNVVECRVLVKVRHRNIVRVLGWFDGREMRGLVMKRVEGERLEDWVLRSFLWKERMKVAVGVAEAMSFLEEEWPKITCDVKADSIMVTQGGEPLIMKLKVHDHVCNSSRGEFIMLFVLMTYYI